jgi:hypothetical protein
MVIASCMCWPDSASVRPTLSCSSLVVYPSSLSPSASSTSESDHSGASSRGGSNLATASCMCRLDRVSARSTLAVSLFCWPMTSCSVRLSWVSLSCICVLFTTWSFVYALSRRRSCTFTFLTYSMEAPMCFMFSIPVLVSIPDVAGVSSVHAILFFSSFVQSSALGTLGLGCPVNSRIIRPGNVVAFGQKCSLHFSSKATLFVFSSKSTCFFPTSRTTANAFRFRFRLFCVPPIAMHPRGICTITVICFRCIRPRTAGPSVTNPTAVVVDPGCVARRLARPRAEIVRVSVRGAKKNALLITEAGVKGSAPKFCSAAVLLATWYPLGRRYQDASHIICVGHR